MLREPRNCNLTTCVVHLLSLQSMNGVYVNKKKLEPLVPKVLEKGDEVCFGANISKNCFKYVFTSKGARTVLVRKRKKISGQELNSPMTVDVAQGSEVELNTDVSQDIDRTMIEEDDLDLTPPLQKYARLKELGEGNSSSVRKAANSNNRLKTENAKALPSERGSVDGTSAKIPGTTSYALDTSTSYHTILTVPQATTLTAPQATTLTAPQATTFTVPQATTLTAPQATTLTAPQATTFTVPQATTLTVPQATNQLTSPVPMERQSPGIPITPRDLCTPNSAQQLTTTPTPCLSRSPKISPAASSVKLSPAVSCSSCTSTDVDDLFDTIVKQSDSSLLDEALIPSTSDGIDGTSIQVMLAKNEMEQEKLNLHSSIKALKSELAAKNDILANKEDKWSEDKVVSSMKEEFTCVICQELFICTHTLSCSHSFCEWCIKNWLKTSQRVCPICRVKVSSEPIKSIVVDNAISMLEAKLSDKEKLERKKEKEEHKRLLSSLPTKRSGSVCNTITNKSLLVKRTFFVKRTFLWVH